MAYCRWSSDDFQCDLYCYPHTDGTFMTHVAERKYVFKQPLPPPTPMTDLDKFIERWTLISEMTKSADLVPLGLPCDGESYYDPDLESMLKRVLELQAMGYRVPSEAIAEMQEDIKEEKKWT